MTNENMLEMYKPLVLFLSELLGPSSEVVLHDIKNPDKSIIAIQNGILSGREVNDPITDLGLELIDKGIYKNKDFISNYTASSKGKDFQSSTYFIKNNGELIGLLCINRDLSLTKDLECIFQRFKSQYNLTSDDSIPYKESLDVSVDEILTNLVQTAISKTGIDPNRMSIQEKTDVVHTLKDQGVLTMKGAITEIASQLKVSEPTIYRYINNSNNK